MAFLNQIGLIHILPTFVPLFAISPLIALALSRGLQLPLLVASAALFCVGHYHPYALDIGQPTIFPFLLFQFYFVVGCVIGQRARAADPSTPSHASRWLVASLTVLLVTTTLVRTTLAPLGLVSTHPLNVFGLLYHGPIIATVCFASIYFWPLIQHTRIQALVGRFGRHALFAFVIHLYLAKAIGIANFLVAVPAPVNYALVFTTVVLMNAILSWYEKPRPAGAAPVGIRALHALFR